MREKNHSNLSINTRRKKTEIFKYIAYIRAILLNLRNLPDYIFTFLKLYDIKKLIFKIILF